MKEYTNIYKLLTYDFIQIIKLIKKIENLEK